MPVSGVRRICNFQISNAVEVGNFFFFSLELEMHITVLNIMLLSELFYIVVKQLLLKRLLRRWSSFPTQPYSLHMYHL